MFTAVLRLVGIEHNRDDGSTPPMISVFTVVQKDRTNELFNCIYVRHFNRNVYWRDYNVNGCAFLLRPAELDRVIEEKLAAVRRDIVQNFSGVHADLEAELGVV